MKRIYLPTLISINVKNYSLYKGDLDLNYDFVNGINLVFGGNGVGKTTFTQLIKYGLIGLYKKDYGFRQTYKGQAIAKREEMPFDYFGKRMDTEVPYNFEANITLKFSLQDREFTVTRKLIEPILEKVTVKDIGGTYNLEGKTLIQSRYERLDSEKKKDYLQFKYEDLVARSSGFNNFDDLIFFVNDILFFDENHHTILWEEGREGIQERLSSKYLIDPALDLEREEAIRKTKYYDSLSRHRSEDIRVVRQLVKTITRNKERVDLPISQLIIQLEQAKTQLDKNKHKINSIQAERNSLTTTIRVENNEKNNIGRKVKQIEGEIRDIEKGIYEEVWSKLNPKYQLYLDALNHAETCPLCNNSVNSKLLEKIVRYENNCILCGQDLKMHTQMTDNYESLVSEMKKLLLKIQQIDATIDRSQDRLESLDSDYRQIQQSLFAIEAKHRQIEFTLSNQTNNNNNDKDTFELRSLLARINELEIEKGEFAKQSLEQDIIRKNITQLIELENEKITQKMSSIFSEFAERFLGVRCFLSYDDYNDGNGKRYVPVIDGKPRLSSDELSESQRFFIDHSYRMSILQLFYQQPSFFVCETPDSSLDISYEQNAADVFLLYLSQPNSLILTSNLNNSQFLEYILSKDVKVNSLNLLKIGRSSSIQRNNVALNSILSKITEQINNK